MQTHFKIILAEADEQSRKHVKKIWIYVMSAFSNMHSDPAFSPANLISQCCLLIESACRQTDALQFLTKH